MSASRVGRPLQLRRPRPTKQVATSAQQSILDRVAEHVDDQFPAPPDADFSNALPDLLRRRRTGPPPRPYTDPRLRQSRKLLKELVITLHRGNLVVYRRSVKAFIGLLTVIKKDGWWQRLIVDARVPNHWHRRPPQSYLATPGDASALDLSDEALEPGAASSLELCGAAVDLQDGFYQLWFKVMSDWFGIDCCMTAAEAGVSEVFDVVDGKGARVSVAAEEAAWPCFCGVPMGLTWALFICHSALTDAMVESFVRVMRCDRALAEAQLLRDGRPAPRLAKGKPIAAPCVDNGNLLCFDREDAGISYESMVAALSERGVTLRDNVECDPNLDMVGFELQGAMFSRRQQRSRFWRLRHALRQLKLRPGCAGEVMHIVLVHLVNFFMLARLALSVLAKLCVFSSENFGRLRRFDSRARGELVTCRRLLVLVRSRLRPHHYTTAFCSDASTGGYAIHLGDFEGRELRDVCRRRERWRFADAEGEGPGLAGARSGLAADFRVGADLEVGGSGRPGANAGDRPTRRAARVSNLAPAEAMKAVEAGLRRCAAVA
ncbi:unnamed protein product [Prorocentrum cordatum]|uniref:Uncharacterized protein n=1 Tax=Prorocentrum cordatum TaxID=2364126 RepID=A0ABN9XK45_9DINO|nr:unnamed protein product [Polarella glacialis]